MREMQLPHPEGLCNVIVSPHVQPHHHIHLVIHSGQRRSPAPLPSSFARRHTVIAAAARQGQIQQIKVKTPASPWQPRPVGQSLATPSPATLPAPMNTSSPISNGAVVFRQQDLYPSVPSSSGSLSQIPICFYCTPSCAGVHDKFVTQSLCCKCIPVFLCPTPCITCAPLIAMAPAIRRPGALQRRWSLLHGKAKDDPSPVSGFCHCTVGTHPGGALGVYFFKFPNHFLLWRRHRPGRRGRLPTCPSAPVISPSSPTCCCLWLGFAFLGRQFGLKTSLHQFADERIRSPCWNGSCPLSAPLTERAGAGAGLCHCPARGRRSPSVLSRSASGGGTDVDRHGPEEIHQHPHRPGPVLQPTCSPW